MLELDAALPTVRRLGGRFAGGGFAGGAGCGGTTFTVICAGLSRASRPAMVADPAEAAPVWEFSKTPVLPALIAFNAEPWGPATFPI